MKRLKFLANPQTYSSDTEFVAHLSEVAGEEELLSKLSKVLNFPDYFGSNWNAVYDCLRDFHWIEKKGIVLIHNELPAVDELTLETYIQVLVAAIQDWQEDEEHYLEVIFPEESRMLVQKYLQL